VIENLNILDYDYYFKVTDAVLSENIPSALLIFNEILNNGFDGHNFIAGMGAHLRNLLVSKDPETLQLLEVGNNIKDKYKEQAGKCSMGFLVKGLGILNKADISYKSSKNQRLQVELALMQLSSLSTAAEGEKKNDILYLKPGSAPVFSPKKEPAPVRNTPVAEIASATVKSIPVPKPETAAPIKKTLLRTATTSIMQHLQAEPRSEKKSEEQEVQTEKYPELEFDQSALERAWAKYANDPKVRSRAAYASSLQNGHPVKKGNLIEFSIHNTQEKERFNEDKMNLLGFLRKELSNYSIQLDLLLIQGEDKASLYTATDRYKRLAEKNPVIHKFRQTFDLDIEF
jgi:DNA polymerase-3 subunit gamma/tau